jgi:hypothetical protein
MNEPDLEYYTRRELQERNRAAASEDAAARRLHEEMADRYRMLLRTITGAAPLTLVA